MKNRRVLVTGGWGFIGRNLVARLLEEGAEVTVVDRDVVDARRLAEISERANGKLQFVLADICDAKAARGYVADQKVIFHLAGHSGPLGSLEEPFTNLEVNCLGTLTLLEAIRKESPKAVIVFPSSRLVYGIPQRLPVKEDHPTEPITLYGLHKLAAEGYLRVYHRHYGISMLIFRASNPYGPHVPTPHHRYNILNRFVDLAMQGKELTVFGEGEQTRDYFYVEDLVEAFLLAATKEEAVGEIFNIGGEPIRFADMAETVVRIVGRGSIEYIPWPSDYERVETGDFISDATKAREVLGWEPKVSLEEGIRRTVEAFEDDSSILGQLLKL